MMAATCKRIRVTHVAMIYISFWLRDVPVWKKTLAGANLKNIGTVQVEDTVNHTSTLPATMTKLNYDTAKSVVV